MPASCAVRDGETWLMEIKLSEELARFALQTFRDGLPPAIHHQARRAFVNWVGCAYGGCDSAAVHLALKALGPHAGPAQATLIGRGERTDILLATLLNTTAVSAHAFDDTHFPSVAHPTAPVAACLIALAERHDISGSNFLSALAVGMEVQCRIGRMLTTSPAEFPVGLSMAGYIGCIGTALAAGLVSSFDMSQLVSAIGIAVNQSAGSRENHGSTVNVLSPGQSARAGLQAALLAEAGYTASPTAIDGEKGLAVSLAGASLPQVALAGLGSEWEISELAFKPYPSGFVIHPSIDACLDIVSEPGFDPTDIAEVSVTVHPLALALTNRPEPANSGEVLVSLQHWVAASLQRGVAGLPEGTDAAAQDPAIADLRRKIGVAADPDMSRSEARVEVRSKDGRLRRAHIRHCRGSTQNPLSDEQISRKFLDQALLHLPAQAARELLDLTWQVDSRPEMASYAARLS